MEAILGPSWAPAHTSPIDLPGRQAPRRHFFDGDSQYRVKVQRYSQAPPEVTVQKVDMTRDQRAYLRAAETGLARVPGPRRSSKNEDEPRSKESLERSQHRAKTAVRKRVLELAPTALLTLTSRGILTDIDKAVAAWEMFTRLVRRVYPDIEYVAVPEWHHSREHLHIHAAIRARVNHHTLRRLWHITLCALTGRPRPDAILRNGEAPGNVDLSTPKGTDKVSRFRRIGKYISKYITKDMIVEFGRRRYWPSKGINLEAAQVFWLDSLDMSEGVREACGLLGIPHDGVAPQVKQFFCPSDRFFWFALDSPGPSS